MNKLFYFLFGVITTLFIALLLLKEDGASLPPILHENAFLWLWSQQGIPLRGFIVIMWSIMLSTLLFNTGKGIKNNPKSENNLELQTN